MGDLHNGTLDFDAPSQPGGSLRSRHASQQGAKAASERIGRQMVTLLTAYRSYGDLTDVEMEQKTGVQKSSVIPRRRALMARGLVQEIGSRKNPATWVTNTTFGLAKT